MYKFQIRPAGQNAYNTIAQFYNNPENDSMIFLVNLLVEHFRYWESKSKFLPKTGLSVNMDFSNYKFTLYYKERGTRKSQVFEFRYYKVEQNHYSKTA